MKRGGIYNFDYALIPIAIPKMMDIGIQVPFRCIFIFGLRVAYWTA